MSFSDRLVTRLRVERPADGAADDYNQPSKTWPVIATVQGLIQQKAAPVEAPSSGEGGAVMSTHTIFLEVGDIRTTDRLRVDPPDGRVFQITGVNDAAGIGHHLECDARKVGPV